MTATANPTELIAVVEDRLTRVGRTVRRSMLDAMPDGEPAQWLYGPMREYPSRPGKACDRRCAWLPAKYLARSPRI